MNHVSYKVPPSGLIFVTNIENTHLCTTRLRYINDKDEERKVSSKLYRETMSTKDMVSSLRARGFRTVKRNERSNRIMLAEAMSSMTDPEQMKTNNEHEELRFLWMNQEMLDDSFDYKLPSGWYPYPAFIEMYGNDLGNKVWLSK